METDEVSPTDNNSGSHAAALSGLASVSAAHDALILTCTDGLQVTLSPARLLDEAPASFHPHNGQRLTPPVSAASRTIEAVRQDEDGVFLTIDGQMVAYTFDALASLGRPIRATPHRTPWRAPFRIRTLSAESFVADPQVRRQGLSALLREGALRLHTMSATMPLEALVETFGQIRETNYGRIFDVRAVTEPDNLASTEMELHPHTDNPYRASPPDLQLLVCRQQAARGGDTLLVDGLSAACRLREEQPDLFAVLRDVPVLFGWGGSGLRLSCRASVIECDAHGDVVRLRVNDRALRGPDTSCLESDLAWRRAYRMLQEYLADPALMVRLALQPGDMLLMDNRTILHGRTAFSGGSRWLEGCYADVDGALSAFDSLCREEAGRRVDRTLAILSGPTGDETYGEGLCLRAHALQAASLACLKGAPQHLVAAALVHDIGWAWDARTHEASGADFVRAYFGAGVAGPVGLHVAAKRYLTAIDPLYSEQLSSASRETLIMQGGPMRPDEITAFLAHPAAQEAIFLRRLDDEAKDPLADPPPLERYRHLLLGCALRALYSEDDHP